MAARKDEHPARSLYAAKIAHRFGGQIITGHDHLYILDKPAKRENGTITPYPYRFDPTFHRYKLDEPQHWKKPRSIFVCSMADLFGEWAPDEWILEVLQACQRAPQHEYVFLTKNPKRYGELYEKYRLFELAFQKYHFGATATNIEQLANATSTIATWLSVEPFMERMPNCYLHASGLKCVVLGAETGNRNGKVIPKKERIMSLVEGCQHWNIPVFMKESLRPIMHDDFRQDRLPWQK